MKNALIVSLNFRVAHVSHLVASYRQFEEIGFRSCLYINPQLAPFLPEDVRYITDLSQAESVDIAVFWFPATGNIREMMRLKSRFGAKIIFVFHEPLETFGVYRSLGLPGIEIAKIYARYLVTLTFIQLSDAILLPSHKAYSLYEDSLARKINSRYYHLPLLFCDESAAERPERKYFSYIGTIAQDHAFDDFVRFIIRASEDHELTDRLRFMIATRNTVPDSRKLREMREKGLLKVIDGHPLSDEEINRCYAESYCVWNAYNRTTQSGVLAKAGMFGTPAIVLRRNLSEFSIEGKNVVCCENNQDYGQIKEALLKLLHDFRDYSENARDIFEKTFYYRNNNSRMKDIVDNILI